MGLRRLQSDFSAEEEITPPPAFWLLAAAELEGGCYELQCCKHLCRVS